jgi:hypothetical protein
MRGVRDLDQGTWRIDPHPERGDQGPIALKTTAMGVRQVNTPMVENPRIFSGLGPRISDTKSRTGQSRQKATFEEAVKVQNTIETRVTQASPEAIQRTHERKDVTLRQPLGQFLTGKEQDLVHCRTKFHGARRARLHQP